MTTGDILISDMILEDERLNGRSEEIDGKSETLGDEEANVEVSQEELDKKYENDELTLSQKAYAYMYEQAMREYFNLKIRLEKQSIKDGDFSYDDRNFLKLMRLKEVATKSELWFKNSTHGSYIGDKIPEISQMEKKEEKELNEYRKQVNKDHEQVNDRIDKINIEKRDTLERIDLLVAKLKDDPDINQDEIVAKIDELNEKYVDLNKNLEAMTPNSIDIARQEEKAKEQTAIEAKEYGYIDRQKQRKSENITEKEVRENKRSDQTKKDLMQNGTSASNDIVTDNIENVKKNMEAAIKKAYDDKDYALALKLVENYQKSLTNDINKEDDARVNKDAKSYRAQIEDKIEDDVEKSDQDADVIVAGFAIGMSEGKAEYPPKPENLHPGLPGLEEVLSPEEIATNTAENTKVLEDVENIANGKHTISDNEKDLKLENNVI